MNIRFYNRLTRSVDPFEPLAPPVVKMYSCGPTVYDYAHIGNFRTFLFADLLRRTLELHGYDVHQVMNLTDVGHMTEDQLADGGGQDKMELAMGRLREAKKSGKVPDDAVADPGDPYQVARFYIDAFKRDAARLRLRVVTEGGADRNLPRATEYVTQMIGIIAKLIERGHAYVGGDGAVYYDVQSFPDYGRLSGNALEDLRGGAGGRVSDETQALIDRGT
jgi:cysteinyl-tRNA synthetase